MTKGAALVTGAAKRIGRAFVLFLARQGYDIALHYNSASPEQKETSRLIEKEGVSCLPIQADLASQHNSLFPLINKNLGPCTLLINNVSVFRPGSFMATSEDQFDSDMAVNLRAPFFLSQDFANQAPKGSQIINMLDCRITRVTTSHFVYNLSKVALYQFTLMAAKELAPHIRVNGIAPGPALPPPDKNEEHLAKVVDLAPLGIASPPATLVQGLGYLLAAQTVTGQVLFVDSGLHLR